MTRHLDTSREAFHGVIPTLNARQATVLGALQGSEPLTNSEIGQKLGWTINRVTPRVLELREMGRVADRGKRKCRVTGRNAYAWAVAGGPEPERKVPVQGKNGVVLVPESFAREKGLRILR